MKITHPAAVLALLAVAAGLIAFAFEARRPQPVAVQVQVGPGAHGGGKVPELVQVERRRPDEDLASLARVDARWRDAEELAARTARMSLPPVVADLQAQRRELEALALGPCATSAALHLKAEMDETIGLYLAFLSGGVEYLQSSMVENRAEAAARLRRNFEAVRATCAS